MLLIIPIEDSSLNINTNHDNFLENLHLFLSCIQTYNKQTQTGDVIADLF